MPHLVNPAGRIVELDDLIEFDRWAATPGFRKATDFEITEFTSRRLDLLQKMSPDAEQENQSELAVYIATVSPGGKDGYGMAANHLIDELLKNNTKISIFQKNQKIGFLFHSPQSLIRLENPFKIVYTMFESDKIPEEWPGYLVDADRVLVPSTWCMEVFAKSGVNTEVVPLGYNDKVFKYVQRENKREAHKDFVFLHYNAFNLRKGFLEVVNAFQRAFEPGEPVKLLLKTTLENLPLPFPPSKYPNIEILRGGVPEEEMFKICQRADCFVYPSRGEGFGIPPLEAMATGIPAIVPNAHGISEYFNTDYMYEVNVKEKCPAIYSRFKGKDVGQMVKCDEVQLAQQMRYIYEHQDEAIEKGRLAADYVKRWTYEKTATRLKAIFDEYLQKEIIDKPLQNLLPMEEVK